MPPHRHIPEQEHHTPSKSYLKGAKILVDTHNLKISNRELFRTFGIPETSGRRLLKKPDRRLHNNEQIVETKGRKPILSENDINKIEALLYNEGYEARSLPWAALPAAANIDVDISGWTVKRALHQKDWRKCTAYTRSWTSPSHAKRREAAAIKSLALRPLPENWENIRFSDETHFAFGPEGKHKIIRKPGERKCPDCIQRRAEPEKEEKYRCHAWAAVGYNFKSELVWYTTPNSNGAMTMKAYREQILEPVVGPWLEQGDQFILEEDGAPGHGHADNNNIIRQWKNAHGLKWYINTPGSPDITPIEKAWRAPKAYVKEHAIWDEDALQSSAEDGWEALTEGTINEWVHEIPQILGDIRDSDGQMTGY